MQNEKKFTLLEIFLIIALVVIFLGIIVAAINPVKKMAEGRNTQRMADVNTILNAVYRYSIDNNSLPASIGPTATEICKTGAVSCDGLVDLSVLTVGERYITSVPYDPSSNCKTDSACYTILKTANNRVVVSAPDAENGIIISVSK